MSDDDLLAQITRKRNDREFMDRLARLTEDNRDVLERLAAAPNVEECESSYANPDGPFGI